MSLLLKVLVEVIDPVMTSFELLTFGATKPFHFISFDRVERVSCQDEKRLIVLSAEEDVDGALRSFDDAYLLACRVVDKDLACGDVDVAGSVAEWCSRRPARQRASGG